MNLMLTSPPALEPMSLAEAKLYLKLDSNDEDDLVRSLITAARLMIEAASGRLLINQTWRLLLDHWPMSGAFRLPLVPVSLVSAARVFNAAGVPTAVAGNALTLETGADPPMIWIEAAIPAPGKVRLGIEIDVIAGYGATASSVPEPFRQAILMLVARWFEHRGDIIAQPDARLPQDVLALISPFRRARL